IITGNLLETYATGAMTQYAVQFPSAGMTFTAVTNNVVNAFFAGQVNYGTYATPPYLQIGCGDSSCNDSPTLRLYSQVTGSSFYSQIVSSWAGNGLTFNLPRTLSGKGYHFQDSGTTDLFVIDSASGAGTFKGGISSQAATEDDGIGNASWKGNTFQLGCTASTCGNNVTLTFGSYVAGTGAVTNGITSSWAGDGIDFTLPRNLQGKGYYFKNNGGSATPVFFDATAPNGSFQVQQTYGQVNIGQMESYTIGTAIASAASISPTNSVIHITGTTTVNTINPYGAGGQGCYLSGESCKLTLIPDGAWALGTSGNIAQAMQSVVGVPITLYYDNNTSKWYPEGGSNLIAGVATLVSGTATVSTTSACAVAAGSCEYILSRCGPNSSTAIGSLSTGTITVGTSFVINSLSATNTVATGDLSTVCWKIN
ncbi:MAG TPA: hypothetical protein VII99_10755, partial [Bacteroidia bacterium]